MPELSIRQDVWDDFVSIAEKQQVKPQTLANRLLRAYVRQFSDEELLQRSAATGRRAPFRIVDTEEIIRRYRRKR